VQGDGAADGIEREIRRLGLALDFDLVQLTLVFADGREGAADAGEGVKIGIGEMIFAGEGSGRGFGGIPGAEGALGGDFAFGLGVGEGAVEVEGLAVADIVHDQVVDGEVQGILFRFPGARFLGEDNEVGIGANDFVEDDTRNVGGFAGRLGRSVGIAAGRNGDDHILDGDAPDVAGNVDDAEEAEIEREARDLEKRRDIGAAVIAEGEAFAGDLHARGGVDVEALQLDVAIEAGAEFTDDPGAGAVVDVACAEIDEEDEADDQANCGAKKVWPEAEGLRSWLFQVKWPSQKAGLRCTLAAR